MITKPYTKNKGYCRTQDWQKKLNALLTNFKSNTNRSKFLADFYDDNIEWFKELNITYAMLMYVVYNYNRETALRCIEDGFPYDLSNIGFVQVNKHPGIKRYKKYNFVTNEYEEFNNEWWYNLKVMVNRSPLRFYAERKLEHLLWIASEKIKKFEMQQIYETIDKDFILEVSKQNMAVWQNSQKVQRINDRLKFDGELSPVRKRKRGVSKDTKGHKRQVDG